ncbi:MAG: glycosyltransferase family 4 protein [Bacteroidota bacterium]|nr:glycosyltransferase family 4 protein [Bacteroidota bacterium]
MKIFFLGKYNQSEYLSGPEKVAKRIYTESLKKYDSFFIEYFFDGRKFGLIQKLFGHEIINFDNNSKIIRLGIITLFFFLLKEKPAIIHIITYERFAAAVFLYRIISQVKIIYNVHGVIYHENNNYKKVSGYYIFKDKICENIFLKYSDKIIFLSDDSIEIASRYFEFDKNKIEIIPNGIDEIFNTIGIRKMSNNNIPLKIVFIGEIERKEKGFEFLYGTLKQINFPYEIFLLCNNMKFKEDNFTGITKLETCKFAEFLIDKDIYISSSEYDPFSISAVETMAAGLVPIVTQQTGMSSYIKQKENGFVINFGDNEKLNGTLELLNSDRALVSNISQNAKLISINLNWQKIFAKYECLYYKLLNS